MHEHIGDEAFYSYRALKLQLLINSIIFIELSELYFLQVKVHKVRTSQL